MLSAVCNSQFMEQFGMRDCIPEGWQKMNIGEACTLVNGRAFKPSDWTKTGTPIVRIQNLNDPNAEFNYCSGDVEDTLKDVLIKTSIE